MGEQPIPKMLEAQRIGKEIFGINIPFLVDGKPAKQIAEKFAAYLEVLAEYDFRNDIVQVYNKRVSRFSERFSVDLDSLILFVICHELGHAREGRLCEESGFFPYTVKISPAPIPFSVNSITYDLRKVQVSGIGFPRIFLNGISDFAVNRELLKHGLFDPLAAKTFVLDAPESMSANLGQEQAHQILIEKSCLLPHNVDICSHGNVDVKLKGLVEAYYRKLLGDKWDYTVDKMEQLEIAKPWKNVEIAKDLLKKIFGVNSFNMDVGSHFVFGSSQIPKFWSKDRYSVLFLC
jgi:hypothetical protein